MDLVVTGNISGTFGVDGFVKVVSSSGEYDHFFDLKRVYVVFSKHKLSKNKFSDGWFDIESVRLIPSFVLLKFEGKRHVVCWTMSSMLVICAFVHLFLMVFLLVKL